MRPGPRTPDKEIKVKGKGKAIALALLLACAPAIHAPDATAQAPGGDAEIQSFNWRKFWDYTGCAVSVALATSTQQWYIAAFGCGKVIMEHWSD
jgi:hypothetical protein